MTSKLIDKIEQDFLGAVKQRNAPLLLILRSLKNALHNLEIEKKTVLTDEDIFGVVLKEIKQRRDSITEFKKGKREDLAKNEENEIKALSVYLPPEIDPQELKKIISGAIAQVNASAPQDAGKVMAILMPKLKGRVNGSELIKRVIDHLKS